MYQRGLGGSTGLGIIPKKYQFYLVLPLKGQLRHICLISGLGCHSFADNNQTMLGCILNQNICTPRVICLSVWDAHGQYLRAQLQGEECRFDQKQMSVLTTESVPAQNKSSFSLVEAEFCRSIKAIHFHREKPLNDLTCSEHFISWCVSTVGPLSIPILWAKDLRKHYFLPSFLSTVWIDGGKHQFLWRNCLSAQ